MFLLRDECMHKACRRFICNSEALTLIELLIVICVIGLLTAIALLSLYRYTSRAYDVTIRYDLNQFVKAEMGYFGQNGHYFGIAGDFIVGGAAGGGLDSPELDFSPSEGVKVEIISGDGAHPLTPPVFKAESSHKNSSVTFIYDFSTDVTTRKEK
jgi:type II secretory pathway pseudopilin PulG